MKPNVSEPDNQNNQQPDKPSDIQQIEHDKYLEELGGSRVSKSHGGELVEAISVDDLELMNDPDCKHETMIPDPTEDLGTAYVCANPKCGIVAIYNKEEKIEDVSRQQ